MYVCMCLLYRVTRRLRAGSVHSSLFTAELLRVSVDDAAQGVNKKGVVGNIGAPTFAMVQG